MQQASGALALLDELRGDAKLGKDKHFHACSRKLRYHNVAGIPVIVINVFIGTIIVFLLADGSAAKWVSALATLLAFFGASLSALQTFFNFHKSAEGHSSIGNRYLRVTRDCKKLLLKHQDIPYEVAALWLEVEKLQADYLEINTDAEAFQTSKSDMKNARVSKEITPFQLPSEHAKNQPTD